MEPIFKNIFAPLITLALCFIVVIFCIDQIIELARPKIFTEINNEPTVKLETEIRAILNNTKIDYQSYQASFSSKLQPNIPTEVSKLSPAEQDSYIRYYLLNRKIEQIEKQIPDMINKASPSLIFNIYFWMWSLFLWAASIVGGEILIFYTKRILHRKSS